MVEIFKSINEREMNGKQLHKVKKTEGISDDCWIDMYSPTEQEIEEVVNTLGIPDEFVRDSLDEEERPRIDYDEDTDSILVIVDVPYTRREQSISKYETTPLGIIITRKNVVTVSLHKTAVLDPFKNNRVKDLVLNYRTRFVLLVLLNVAKDYLRLLRYIDKNLDLTASNLQKGIKNEDLYEIMEISKTLVYFTTSLKSDEAVIDKLIRGRRLKKYNEDEELLDDVMIEFRQAHEMSEIYTNIVNNTQEAYSSIINNNMNVVMKVLAAATIIMEIPNIFTSFFGQNCPMPWDEGFKSNPLPFICITVFCIATIVVSTWFMKRKGLLK